MKRNLLIILGILITFTGCAPKRSTLCWADDQKTFPCHYYSNYSNDGYRQYKDGGYSSTTRVLKHCPKPVHCDDQYHYNDKFSHDGSASYDSYHVIKGCGHCNSPVGDVPMIRRFY